MGSGSYNSQTRTIRAQNYGYYTKAVNEIFSSRLDSEMNPNGVIVRESRDSEEHPESLAIIIALDVTGSMGRIPHDFVQDGLPLMVDTLIKSGIEHPQIMFIAIGDHHGDRAPLQISQFESNDELLDKWLTKVWLEGSGQGNSRESYSLAHLFAGYFTSIDCWEKRKQKGFLFTIGDESVHRSYSNSDIQRITGNGDLGDQTDVSLLTKAEETYNVFHVALKSHYDISRWHELLGENVLSVENYKDIPQLIAYTINNSLGNQVISPVEELKIEQNFNKETEVL